jgi:hypothetical protein
MSVLIRILMRAAAFLVGLLFIAALLIWWISRPPSDTSLTRQFFQHKDDIDRILAMMNQDVQMNSVAPNFLYKEDNASWPRPEAEWGISPQRWSEYKALFAKVGSKAGSIRRERSSDVMIDVWGVGIVPSGTSVSYLHCGSSGNGLEHTEPPCLKRDAAGSGQYKWLSYRYTRLTDDWYIYQEIW